MWSGNGVYVSAIELLPQPLTRMAFQQFGDVIEKEGAVYFSTNNDTAIRYHDLARIETTAQDGRSVLSIFKVVQPADLPLRLNLLERHPISSQAFVPLGNSPFLIVVAPNVEPFQPSLIRAFITNGYQGVNFHSAIWHHPLIALGSSEFLVVDRSGPGKSFNQDYEEIALDDIEVRLTG